MHVLLSCLQSKAKHPIAAYQFWELYFKNGIEEAGWTWSEVPDVDWAEPLVHDEADTESIGQWRARSWQRVLEFVRREHAIRPFDLFLGYLYPRQVAADAIAELQHIGIPCVNFFCDNVREFRQVPNEYKCFDLHWVPEYGALAMYEQAGLPYVHAAMPVWVPPSRRRWDHDEQYGPTFIGGRDAQRERLFADALGLGADIRLRGPGWGTEPPRTNADTAPLRLVDRIANQSRDLKRFGFLGLLWKMSYRLRSRVDGGIFEGHVDPAAFGDSYADVTQHAMITIGVNRYPSYFHSFLRPGRYSRLRDIEAPMLGACYLTEWADGMDLMYDLGEEIETFRSVSELVEKLNQLRKDKERRRRMRRLGQMRALSDHAIPRSLERLAASLGVRA